MRLRTLIVAGSLAASCLVPPGAIAQDGRLEIREKDTVKSVLERHVGKRVGLVMESGPDLTGVVVNVGDHVVHLGELQGREFFDAAVRLDRINAVVIRARGR
jgi:hypothetical protein